MPCPQLTWLRLCCLSSHWISLGNEHRCQLLHWSFLLQIELWISELFSKYVAATQFLFFGLLLWRCVWSTRGRRYATSIVIEKYLILREEAHIFWRALFRDVHPKKNVVLDNAHLGILGHGARAESRTTMMVICWGQSGIITQWMEGTREEPLPIRWNCSSDIAVHETCHVWSHLQFDPPFQSIPARVFGHDSSSTILLYEYIYIYIWIYNSRLIFGRHLDHPLNDQLIVLWLQPRGASGERGRTAASDQWGYTEITAISMRTSS